ncbi:hypothetical protein [Deinococcus radiophilus]|uniref:Uncharacterized protein n=1 Tax=Deinococcus radiophilus TaxID=32062 RepID=A0A3S0IFY1_9DEIO|nr:hypothetical protein [Deinococcus radiophilus]RTR21387.1 hypothetical protein EJ104_13020 [Deinococcus radiophilus]UFA52078.1 hypothetical protein LMT64_14110 [Deinococcus radiophilus]
MGAESYEQQISRELIKLRVEKRLKGAPHFNWWEIGESGRTAHKGIDGALVSFTTLQRKGTKLTEEQEKALEQLKEMYYNPMINPYTLKMLNEDDKVSSGYPLWVDYGYEEGIFRLNEPEKTTEQIKNHFHPISWKEFENASDWELMREVIPAMKNTKVRLEIYEDDRWLYDERSQRAAETLAYRIEHVYGGNILPKKMEIVEQQYAILAEYDNRLGRGIDARRWIQAILKKLASTNKKPRVTAQSAVEQN